MSNENMTHPVQVLHLKSETTLVSSGRRCFSFALLKKGTCLTVSLSACFCNHQKVKDKVAKKEKATPTETVNKDRQESCSVSRSVQTPDRRVGRHLAGAAGIMRVPETNLRSDVGVWRGPCCTTDKQITRCNAHAI